MNHAQKTLLALLKCALHQKTAEGDPETDWSAVFAEASIQTVTALAAKALPSTLSNAERAQWRNAEYVQLAHYVRYLAAQDELCRLFRDCEIPMAILKGSAAAMYYPQPSLRAMGDIDLIVAPELYPRAKALMLEAGYAEKHESMRHCEMMKNGIEFELHNRFSRGLDIESYVTEGLKSIAAGTIEGHDFPMLPRLSNGMVLLEHMRSHLESGMGLRQMIDWMMYVERELDDEFWNSCFCAAAKEKKLDVLATVAARTCQKYLGLSDTVTWCSGADERLCDILVENVLSSGNFGQKHGTGGKVEMVANNIRKNGFLRNLQMAGLSNWIAAKEHPALRPFAWLYQIFRYSGQIMRARRGKRIIEDLNRSRERLEMLEKLNIK